MRPAIDFQKRMIAAFDGYLKRQIIFSDDFGFSKEKWNLRDASNHSLTTRSCYPLRGNYHILASFEWKWTIWVKSSRRIRHILPPPFAVGRYRPKRVAPDSEPHKVRSKTASRGVRKAKMEKYIVQWGCVKEEWRMIMKKLRGRRLFDRHKNKMAKTRNTKHESENSEICRNVDRSKFTTAVVAFALVLQ